MVSIEEKEKKEKENEEKNETLNENIVKWTDEELRELYEIINRDVKNETNNAQQNISTSTFLEQFPELQNNVALYYLVKDIIERKTAIELTDKELKMLGLVRIYKVNFLLPSKNLIILERDVQINLDKLTYNEIQIIERKLYNKIQAFRNRVIYYLKKICHEHTLGWITVSSNIYEIVEFLKKELESLKKDCIEYIENKIAKMQNNRERKLYQILLEKLKLRFREYNIRVIPIFLYINDAIQVFEEILAKIVIEKEELEKEIEEISKHVKDKKDKVKLSLLRMQLNDLVNKYYMFSEKLKFIKS